jgi:hypothetical protein
MFPDGESFLLRRTELGDFCCPVCGRVEFAEPPYYTDGSASFQMCSCGFEFGFDDSPHASPEAVDGIQENWKRWRITLVEAASKSSDELNALEATLANIDIVLAFDLIPVEKTKPNKAVDSTATRVTPPASSLRSGQESRRGQP